MGGDLVGCEFRPTSWQERYLTPFALRRAALTVCWSRNLRQMVAPMTRPGAPTAVVVGGVDRRVFRPGSTAGLRESLGLGPEDFVVFSPRIFRPLYNIDIIVRAFSAVVERVPRARLVLVKHHASESPDYTRKVESLLDDLSLRSVTRLLTEIPNPEMARYYRAADCTVSIPDTDGTPMTVLESMACGTPVVIQDLPEYDPLVFIDGWTVLKVPARQPGALAHALIRLAQEPSTRTTLREQGPATAAAHADYFAEMARLESLYRDVLRSAEGRRRRR
jgi:glycosyltransferase involved in cell wall biosynthesis